MCSPSRSPLPPPSPLAPPRFSQCTRSESLSHASNLGWCVVWLYINTDRMACSQSSTYSKIYSRVMNYDLGHVCISTLQGLYKSNPNNSLEGRDWNGKPFQVDELFDNLTNKKTSRACTSPLSYPAWTTTCWEIDCVWCQHRLVTCRN